MPGSYLRLSWSANLLAAPGVCSTMHGRTQEAESVSAISLATIANDGLDVFIRATNVSAATLSERTCKRGELPTQACSHAFKPKRMAKASATCWELLVPNVMPTAGQLVCRRECSCKPRAHNTVHDQEASGTPR